MNRKKVAYRQAYSALQKVGGSWRVVSLPIDVTPDTPLDLIIPTGPANTCIWVGVKADPKGAGDNGGDPDGGEVIIDDRPVLNPILDPILPLPRPLPSPRPQPFPFPEGGPVIGRDGFGAQSGTGPVPFGGAASRAGSGLKATAHIATLTTGMKPVSSRSAAPYNLSGPNICRVTIRGTGRVRDLDWIAMQDQQRLDLAPVTVLNLPHPGGRRYLALSDAVEFAFKRVEHQAPQRRPLQETTGAPGPAAAAGFVPGQEVDRVKTLVDGVVGHLDPLINDPKPQLLQTAVETVLGQNGQPLSTQAGDVSTLEIPLLNLVGQAQIDPGTAGLFGYQGYDQRYKDDKDSLVFYHITGFFRDLPDPLPKEMAKQLAGLDTAIGQLPANARTLSRDEVVEIFSGTAGTILSQENLDIDTGALDDAKDYMMFEFLAVADRLAPPDQPDAPSLLHTYDKGWLPVPPPQARREVGIVVDDAMTAALLAAIRRDPPSGTNWTPLNPQAGNGWHRAIVLGQTAIDPDLPQGLDPGDGTLTDLTAGPPAARYHVAQSDRFGRWSPFAAITSAPGERPGPPKAMLSATYAQPSAADAPTNGGIVTASVPLPDPDTLAPAALPLAFVRLEMHHFDPATPDVITNLPDIDIDLSAPVNIDPAPSRALRTSFQGPVLGENTERRLSITAHWHDTGTKTGAPSVPIRLRLLDPRPPQSPSLNEVLSYSARPDATGLAWVEERWSAKPNARYGVYFSDETRLVSYLAEEGHTAITAQLDAALDRRARAQVLRSNAALFPDHLFERLDGVVFDAGSGQQGFRHALPGAMRMLCAYKIAAEGAQSGARPVLNTIAPAFYGVPNSDPPPRPIVELRMDEATGDPLTVRVTIRAPLGQATPVSYTLYRTAAGRISALNMPVAATGRFGAPNMDTGECRVSLADLGEADIAPPGARLRPFGRYAWTAVVQGAPEAGSSPPIPGRTSRLSDPVALTVIPPLPPEPFSAIAVASGTAPTVNLAHSADLSPTASGYWRLQLERAMPGAAMALLSEGDIIATPVTAEGFATPGETVPPGTRYRATLIDPVGRPAPAIETVTT